MELAAVRIEMNETELQTALQDLPLGGLCYLKSVGSTNDIALDWASQNADDLSIVVADEQTAGRGRNKRAWHTPPDSALAFSLILHPRAIEKKNISLFTGLGALALVTSLQKRFGLQPKIKWPNDVLLDGKKVAGILVETSWLGNEMGHIVLGVGVNINAAAVPLAEQLTFPATCLEDALGKKIHRPLVLHDILAALIKWRHLLGTDAFIHAWDENLAFRGEQVWVHGRGGESLNGKLLGLDPDGSLQVQIADKSVQNIHFGDVHLRPIAL